MMTKIKIWMIWIKWKLDKNHSGPGFCRKHQSFKWCQHNGGKYTEEHGWVNPNG